MRTSRADELLRRLGSGVRPSDDGVRAGVSPDSPDFQELLRSARSGELTSGRRVRIDLALGVDLTDEQQEELDRAADAAEAAGADVLAAFTEEAVLIVGVPDRRAADVRSLRPDDEKPAVLTGIDAAVMLSPAPVEEEGGDTPGEPLASGLRKTHAGRIGSDALIRSLGRSPIPAIQSGDR